MTDETVRVGCACGWEAVGTEAEVVAAAIEHGQRVHNMTATPDQVRATLVPVGAKASGDPAGTE